MSKLEKILETVRKDDENKQDFVIPVSGLFMDCDGELHSNAGEGRFKLNDYSSSQLFSRLGMPGRYFKGLMEQHEFELVSEHVNYGLDKVNQDVKWLFRTRLGNNLKLIRGILSDKYSRFDNKDLVDIVSKIIGAEGRDHEIEFHELTDGSFHMRVLFPKLTTQIGKTIDGQEDILRVGVHLVNSEVGKYSIRVAPMVYRLVCTNGLMMWTTDGEIFSQRHIYLDEDEMFGRVSKAVGSALRVGAETVQLLKESRDAKIESPLNIIDSLAKEGDFSQAFTDSIKNSFMEEPETTAYGIINAFTRSARNLVADERIEVESFAGKILRGGIKIA